MKETIASVSRLTCHVCFVGDLNARDLSWDARKGDHLRSYLLKFCDSRSLLVLNSVFAPGVATFPSSGSTLDLAISSDPSLFIDFEVFSDPLLSSDHLAISVHVNLSGHIAFSSPQGGPRLDYSRADWVSFSSVLSDSCRKAETECKLAIARHRESPAAAVDDLHFILTSCLHAAAAAAIPSRRVRANPKHWWTQPGVADALARLRRARLRAKRSDAPAAKAEWNAARANWKRVTKDAQSRSWSAFCCKILRPHQQHHQLAAFQPCVKQAHHTHDLWHRHRRPTSPSFARRVAQPSGL